MRERHDLLDVLIIGSGPLGMTTAVCLCRRGMPPAGLRLLDPHPEPLACWRRRAEAVCMPELRSPAWYHIDPRPASLMAYAAAKGRALDSSDQRPSLQLFEDHTRQVITESGLDHAGVTGTAQGFAPVCNGWRVATGRDALYARSVVLALGNGEHGDWPHWARSLERRGVLIGHVLESEDRFWQTGTVAVVGGGLSAAQVAVAAARNGQSVVMFVKRLPRIANFDFDPKWFCDDAPSVFRSAYPVERRTAALARARNPGSVPPATAECLARYRGEGPGRIRLVSESIERVAARGSGVRFFLATSTIDADHVVLATGFDRHLPGSGWLERTARALGLPVAPSGHPVLDAWLQWAPGLYVCGALAELEVGPAARGLAGGRQAGRLIAQHLCNR